MQCTNTKCPHYMPASKKPLMNKRRCRGFFSDIAFLEKLTIGAGGCRYGYCKLNERKGGLK